MPAGGKPDWQITALDKRDGRRGPIGAGWISFLTSNPLDSNESLSITRIRNVRRRGTGEQPIWLDNLLQRSSPRLYARKLRSPSCLYARERLDYTMETFLTQERVTLGTFFSEYLDMSYQKYADVKSIQEAYLKLSPAEKLGVLAFVKANMEERRIPGMNGSWFLATIRHQDTGRRITIAGYSSLPPGVNANVFRSCLGLPRIVVGAKK